MGELIEGTDPLDSNLYRLILAPFKPKKTVTSRFVNRWVFRQLWDKGLIYRGFRVMPYSTGCTTPLANFEATQNYKEVTDPAVIVSFPLDEDPNVKMIAWTTTPWTLPSNLALCVHPELTYVKVLVRFIQDSKQHYLLICMVAGSILL